MNFLNKLFGKKPKEELRIYVNAYDQTPEQEAMWQEQNRIKDALGFYHGNDHQNWLRLHQILLNHDERLKKLENGDG
tara:strand:+ start:4998 stop:5228 length:231 start_codon:yes stop_codon:yes gene_type:complete